MLVGFGNGREKTIINGCGYALAPEDDTPADSYIGPQQNDLMAYRLDFPRGMLDVHLKITEERRDILLNGGNDIETPRLPEAKATILQFV